MTREIKKIDNIEKRKKVIIEIFSSNGSLQHGQFCEIYNQKTGLSLVTVARHLAEMIKSGVVIHDEEAKTYSLEQAEQKSIEQPQLTDDGIKNNEIRQWVEENYEDCPF